MKLSSLSASKQLFCYDAKVIDAGLLRSSSCQGNFLLKNGQTSTYPVYNQEAGIFIDENLYIPLKMSKQLFTAQEAKVYFDILGVKIPDFYQIVRLKLALEKVNSSLRKVGMEEFVIPTDVLKNLWYEEALEYPKSDEVRRCVVISEYGNYQKPSYQEFNNSCLLFNDTLLYHRTDDCYEPISPVLVFNWAGIDFLRADVGGVNYVFYRGKDNKLVFLGVDCYIEFMNHELIRILTHVYQCCDGKLHEICYVSDHSINYSYDKNANQVVVSYEDEYVLDGITEERWEKCIYFQKNENGVFVEVGSDDITTYKRSTNF